ncbi:phosphomannomutase/phosphoglucomutase [Streptomyces kronopolitis]|uniref:phosphomannomutase/phosphoglucomutase n=1 Tax=Streptomyces kronopolitis TaxID=1612435 RepID=UPI003445F8E7
MPDYSRLVKAYDIRGEVPSQMNTDIASKVGALFIRLTGAEKIVVARDMRSTSPDLAAAFAAGANRAGADVIDAGLGSTDYLYFASGKLGLPGVMITASHNPAKDNGIKLCQAGAAPIGEDTGLGQIRTWLETGDIPTPAAEPGTTTSQELLSDYAAHLNSLVDLLGIRRLKVVADAGNGMAGHTVPAVFDGLPIDLVPLYFELDGTFPNHEANPLEPKNLLDLQAKVTETGADIGLAFDGDADRCFFIDEKGQAVSPSAIVGLVAARELAKHPGSAIVHNVITSAAAVEIIREHGGQPVRSRVGHSFMKALMAEHDAVFGGEHSGHYYFRDFWRADTGMLTALHVLAALGEQDRPLSELVADYSRYAASGEINSEVADVPAKLDEVEAAYQQSGGVKTDRLDGLTVDLGDGRWFNLRPSNTEPLLRLNVEAPTQAAVDTLRDEVLALVRS